MPMIPAMVQTAVVLVGFGCPADPRRPRPFLFEIFSDPIASPLRNYGIFMRPAAHALAFLAEGQARRRYLNISGMRTTRQMVNDLAGRLQAHLQEMGRPDMVVFPAMRYGEPSLRTVLTGIARAELHDVILLPLFAQRAIATTGSIEAEARRICLRPPCYDLRVRFPDAWYTSTEFVMSWVDAIREALKTFPIAIRDRVHLVFSAHAIPKEHVDEGDVYIEQVQDSARLINDSLGRILPMSVAFQSAPTVGEWSRPSLEDELTLLGMKRTRDVLIVPLSFLYDNIETWCDIDMDILPRAKAYGFERLKRVVPPLESDRIVNALAAMVK